MGIGIGREIARMLINETEAFSRHQLSCPTEYGCRRRDKPVVPATACFGDSINCLTDLMCFATQPAIS